MDTENRLTVVKGVGVRGWVRTVMGLSTGEKKLMDTNDSMVNVRGKGEQRE